MPSPICLYMLDGGETGVIQAWFAGQSDWVEFRGNPYSRWSIWELTPMARIHDSLEGWHSCVLHTDSILTLLGQHPDYIRVREMIDEAGGRRATSLRV